MDWLGKTFIPSDLDGSERRTISDQPIIIYTPKQQRKIAGLTFVVTAANMPLSKYISIINSLTVADHVVVGFFINVLNPPIGNHRTKAEKIEQIFHELKDEFRVSRYDIVGHSIGGKIALLTAALYDEDKLIRNIIALDPVDQSPVEFTHNNTSKKSLVNGNTNGSAPQDKGGDDERNTTSKRRGRTNLSLASSQADITITLTDTGYWINKKHNARAIQSNNPNLKLVMHRNSCHMVYCDDEGVLSWKMLMGKGSSLDRNQKVRDETLAMVKERDGHAFYYLFFFFNYCKCFWEGIRNDEIKCW